MHRSSAADGLLQLAIADVQTNTLPAMAEMTDDSIPSTSEDNVEETGTSSQTPLTMAYIEALEKSNQQLLSSKQLLVNRVANLEFSHESFANNPEKIKVFTGLTSFKLFLVVFNLILPNLKHKTNASLSPFHQLLLTLMKLRLNVTVQYLSFVFNVHHSTIVRTFSDVIHILNEKCVPLTIIWAERSEIKETLPYIFKDTYPKCVSIIDCFEIFIERPSNLDAKAKTYSNYKSHNTVKYLISMAPQGFVNFISKGWGGRTSDKYLTEQSGYLKRLVAGDTVLADRGFNIQDDVALYGAKLEIPAFTKGKKQLDTIDVNKTRHLASIRIHIERVIGHIRKKYPMLDSTIPITYLQTDENTGFTTLDKIVRVACGLTNICESVVPFD